MSFRKTLAPVFIVLMLLAQLALAQHATVHFQEDQYASHQQHGDNGSGEPDKSKLCQICITAKQLHDIFSHADFVLLALVLAYALSLLPERITRTHAVTSSYSARAPPILLS